MQAGTPWPTTGIAALCRFGAGQDLRDAALFRPAWTDILASLEPLVTTHTVTNPRVTLTADRARLFALVEAKRVRRDDRTCFLLLKNFYDCKLAHEGGLWRIAKMRIVNAWYEGEPRALFPAV